MGQTYIEKIAQRYAVGLEPGHAVHAGDFLSVRPEHIMTHDNTSAVIPKFESVGATRIFDADQLVIALDHDIQNQSPENQKKYGAIEAFARRHGLAFYPAGSGIGHQIMVEEGWVLPGTLVVASDSHSNLYGALAALGTPCVRTDAAAIWATGHTWWEVPEIVRVNLRGRLQDGVSGKDVILALIGAFPNDEVLNCCVEFTGPGVAALDMDERMTIANMTTEWGALAGVFPYDDVTRRYLLERAEVQQRRGGAPPRLTKERITAIEAELPAADCDANYARELDFDLLAVTPLVAGPNEVKTFALLAEIESAAVKIDKAFLLSCVNGRLGDFAEAAHVLEGRHVAPGVSFFIAAASSEIESEARRQGFWDTLVAAGAKPLPPGCGPCIGLGTGVLAEGEVAISATNRNFQGRMGARTAQVYLASPAVVAASAAEGVIAGPRRVGNGRTAQAQREALRRACASRQFPRHYPSADITIHKGFPARLAGELLFVPKDNLNTDGIYGKEFTYQKDLTPAQMSSKAMLNYDPRFQEIARKGDILVGGYNFGSGSSREQAATSLKFRGIRMVIAGSYSQTYKRNAFNNGYIVLECQELVDDLKKAHAGDAARTIRTGRSAEVDFQQATIACSGKTYRFAPLGGVAQELVAHGGFEAVIQQEVAMFDGDW